MNADHSPVESSSGLLHSIFPPYRPPPRTPFRTAGRLGILEQRGPDGGDLLDHQPRMQDARRPSPEGSASLHAEILTRLRDFIVEGHLPPGARVPERQLCETLAVSRTPLREALKVLAAEGLIELLPNRGARVREFAEKDIREVFEIVAGLEFVAGRLACEAISDEEIATIERMHYDTYTHYMRRELGEYFQLNQKIHEAIVEASRNLILRSALRKLQCADRADSLCGEPSSQAGGARRCANMKPWSTRCAGARAKSLVCSCSSTCGTNARPRASIFERPGHPGRPQSATERHRSSAPPSL